MGGATASRLARYTGFARDAPTAKARTSDATCMMGESIIMVGPNACLTANTGICSLARKRVEREAVDVDWGVSKSKPKSQQDPDGGLLRLAPAGSGAAKDVVAQVEQGGRRWGAVDICHAGRSGDGRSVADGKGVRVAR